MERSKAKEAGRRKTIREKANALKDRFGIDALRDVFRLHGGEKLKDIPESNYAALMDDLRNLMKEDV